MIDNEGFGFGVAVMVIIIAAIVIGSIFNAAFMG